MRYLVLFFFFPLFLNAQFSPNGSPTLTYNWVDSTEICEYMFFGTYRFIAPSPMKPTNMILDRNGNLVWYEKSHTWMLDFKMHPNGLMSYFQEGRFLILDSTFNIVDSVKCDSRATDVHDMLMLDDGGFFIICGEGFTMDLSSLNTINGDPGDTNAYLWANIIQELDSAKNMVKEWRLINYFDIYDADTAFFVAPDKMELNHTNSVCVDSLGNVLISSRANHELTYIDWSTGNIIWRLGGNNNQFTYINDSTSTNSQHDARVIGPGLISVFDNSSKDGPGLPRGMIYRIDTTNMTAENVVEYANPNVISGALGSFQVQPNGDALANFGSLNPNSEPNIIYFKENGNRVLEIKFQDTYWTYRAKCFDINFNFIRPEIICQKIGNQYFLSTNINYSSYEWTTGETTSSIVVADTGDVQVFVPYGVGMIGSEVLHISDLLDPCAVLSIPEFSNGSTRNGVTGKFDLLGREIDEVQRGQLYIEVYKDGSSKKKIGL